MGDPFCLPRIHSQVELFQEVQQNYPVTLNCMSFSPGQNNENGSVLALEQCITHVHTWLLQNNILLNDKNF